MRILLLLLFTACLAQANPPFTNLVTGVDSNVSLDVMAIGPWTSNNIPVHAEVNFRLRGTNPVAGVLIETRSGPGVPDWEPLTVLSGDDLGDTNTIYRLPFGLFNETNGIPNKGSVQFRGVVLDDAAVCHPHTGTFPKVLTDVAYDVDLGQSLDLSYTAYLISNAVGFAAANRVTNDLPDYILGDSITSGVYQVSALGDPFHYWPNLFDLTRIFEADTNLFHSIVDGILTGQVDRVAIVADLTARVEVSSNRVYLARDFVTEVIVGDIRFDEVHYGIILDLDAEEVFDIPVHGRLPDGLADLHDAHTDVLQAIFDEPPGGSAGERWHMCLRGNRKIHKYQSIIIDQLPTVAGPEEFYLRRIHETCSYWDPPWTNVPPPEVPIPPPWWPTNPPPPKMGPPITKVPPLDPPEVGGPPVRPWGFRDNDEPEDAGEPDQSDNKGGAVSSWTVDEQNKLNGLIVEFTDAHAAMKTDYEEDWDKFFGQSYCWVPGQVYTNPALQQLYEHHGTNYTVITQQIAAVQAVLDVVNGQDEAAYAALPIEVRALIRGMDWWCEIIDVGGPWSNCKVECANVVATYMSLEFVVVTDVHWKAFTKDILVHMKNGGDWTSAVTNALANPKIYQGYKFYEIQMWQNYAECLRHKLYPMMFRKWMEHRNWSEADIDAVLPILFDREAALTGPQQTTYTSYTNGVATRAAASVSNVTELANLHNESKDVNRQFRADALANVWPLYIKDLDCLLNARQLLLNAQAECQSGQPQNMAYVGSTLDLLQAVQKLKIRVNEIGGCPSLTAFLDAWENTLNPPPS